MYLLAAKSSQWKGYAALNGFLRAREAAEIRLAVIASPHAFSWRVFSTPQHSSVLEMG